MRTSPLKKASREVTDAFEEHGQLQLEEHDGVDGGRADTLVQRRTEGAGVGLDEGEDLMGATLSRQQPADRQPRRSAPDDEDLGLLGTHCAAPRRLRSNI
jgi:hypothetical protein